MCAGFANFISLSSLLLVFGLTLLQEPFAASSMAREIGVSALETDWHLTVDLDVFSIDMKTETLFTSYYLIALWSHDNTSAIRGAIFKSDKGGSHGFSTAPIEDTERQRFSTEIATDPTKVAPWEWKLHPVQRLLGLGSPFDQYELSVLIALNETIRLRSNFTDFRLPTTLRGEWKYTEQLERLTTAPSNWILQAHGIDPNTFASYTGNEMVDFYLYTAAIKPIPMHVLRMVIAFLFPPVVILILLILVAFRYEKLSRSDLLRIYLATAFFILPFLLAFYQYAPPVAFTWQEALFLFDFCFATSLVSYSILKKDDSDKEKER